MKYLKFCLFYNSYGNLNNLNFSFLAKKFNFGIAEIYIFLNFSQLLFINLIKFLPKHNVFLQNAIKLLF